MAGRKVAPGGGRGERFPHVRDQLVAGNVPAVVVHKVVDACAGLDVDACAAVDAQVAPRLAGVTRRG